MMLHAAKQSIIRGKIFDDGESARMNVHTHRPGEYNRLERLLCIIICHVIEANMGS